MAKTQMERTPERTAPIPASGMVLLIDDQQFVGEAVRRLLEDADDLAFHFCDDPLKTIEIANRILPTVILLDLVMPGADGLEVLRSLRANKATAETPVVVLSTKEDAVVKRDAFAFGASDYLVKLPDRIELLARIRYHSKACLNARRRAQIADALRASQSSLAERVSELQNALEEIESLQQAKADFYSIVTHDLRNPAGNVQVSAKILLDGKAGALTQRQRQFVEIASNAGDKLMRLITDYLDFAKIDAGYLRLDRTPTDLTAVARRAFASIELHAAVKHQVLRLELPDELLADADGGKLEQTLENLLSNAVKYAPDEGTITLSLDCANECARFSVRDTGAGIDPSLIPTLFAKYHRLAGNATRASPGTGLGLLIAKEIVEAHGGNIAVSSSGIAGEGTLFVVEIPLAASLAE